MLIAGHLQAAGGGMNGQPCQPCAVGPVRARRFTAELFFTLTASRVRALERAPAGQQSGMDQRMAAGKSYVDRGERTSMTRAETAACSVLAEYTVPPEILLKEWYLTSYAAVRNSILMSSAKRPESILLCGSRADGLSQPDLLLLLSGSLALSDYDKMFPIVGRRWHGNDDKPEVTVPSLALEPVASDPRYYRLVPDQDWRDELRRRHPSYDGGYLPSRYFVDPLGQSWAGAEVSVHGPAVRLVNGSAVSLHQQDMVDSVQLDAWPAAIAADWLQRVRPSGWPDERLVRNLVDSEPVFLTPTGRSDSPTDEALEWRLSFSLPERRLALSLTAAQRTAYVLVKVLMKAEAERCSDGNGEEAASFRSFYLKNALFWACETELADTWQRPADGARALLALVERCCCETDGRLPSYFVPASNLLDREPTETLRAAARARRLRERPLDTQRLVATPQRAFLSLGIIDYEPLWRWVDDEVTAAAEKPEAAEKLLTPHALTSSLAHLTEPPPSGSPAPVDGSERALTFLFAAYATLLKRTQHCLEAAIGDRELTLIARVTRSLIESVASRLAVDIYSHRRRRYVATLGGGRYVLSRETSEFEAFAR